MKRFNLMKRILLLVAAFNLAVIISVQCLKLIEAITWFRYLELVFLDLIRTAMLFFSWRMLKVWEKTEVLYEDLNKQYQIWSDKNANI